MATTATKRRRKTTGKKQNKSEAIRVYLEAHKGAKPKEVIEALAAKGLEITPNLVSIIKGKMGSKKTKGRARDGGNEVGANHLQEVVAFIRICGSMDQAKKVLLNAEQLADLLR